MVALGLYQKVSNGGNVVGNRKVNYTPSDCWKHNYEHRENLRFLKKIYYLAPSLICLCMTAWLQILTSASGRFWRRSVQKSERCCWDCASLLKKKSQVTDMDIHILSQILHKVNRCLARYSPRATPTNRPTNRAPNACPGPNWPKMPILGQIWSFLGKKSFFLLEKSKVSYPHNGKPT